MRLRVPLLCTALATASLIATSPAPATASCTHADGLVSVNVCVDPAEPSASVRVCRVSVRMACSEIGTRDR